MKVVGHGGRSREKRRWISPPQEKKKFSRESGRKMKKAEKGRRGRSWHKVRCRKHEDERGAYIPGSSFFIILETDKVKTQNSRGQQQGRSLHRNTPRIMISDAQNMFLPRKGQAEGLER